MSNGRLHPQANVTLHSSYISHPSLSSSSPQFAHQSTYAAPQAADSTYQNAEAVAPSIMHSGQLDWKWKVLQQ
jgi:hypothetical protein